MRAVDYMHQVLQWGRDPVVVKQLETCQSLSPQSSNGATALTRGEPLLWRQALALPSPSKEPRPSVAVNQVRTTHKADTTFLQWSRAPESP